ncbi:hypothetical protein G9A89_013819 [Geosiphon pyriformis]|nr:hypothetical protein G9A89_013819 [Geosiphon pyriformis]
MNHFLTLFIYILTISVVLNHVNASDLSSNKNSVSNTQDHEKRCASKVGAAGCSPFLGATFPLGLTTGSFNPLYGLGSGYLGYGIGGLPYLGGLGYGGYGGYGGSMAAGSAATRIGSYGLGLGYSGAAGLPIIGASGCGIGAFPLVDGIGCLDGIIGYPGVGLIGPQRGGSFGTAATTGAFSRGASIV